MSRTRRPTKTEETRSAIFASAMKIARAKGLQHVTLNAVAHPIGITRSGVSKHVGSVEELQHRLVEQAHRSIYQNVFEVAMQAPRGLPRLDVIVDRWITHVSDMRVFLVSHLATSVSADNKGGDRIHAEVFNGILAWRQAIKRTIEQSVQQQHLRPDTDPAQLAFEIQSIMTGYLCSSHGHAEPSYPDRARRAYARLLSTYRTPPP